MRKTAIFPLSLMVGMASLPACKKNPTGADAEPSKAAPEKAAPAAEKKAEEPAEKKAPEPVAKQAEPAKNCIGSLEPSADYLPGTLVSLPTPKGLKLSRRFPGYERGKGKAKISILVSDFALPYKTVKQALSNASVWEMQQLKLLSTKETEEKNVNGPCSGILFDTESLPDADGEPVRKFAWIFGDDKRSVQVLATCPKPCAEADVKTLRAAVQSARWNPEREAKRWERMPFTVDASPLKPLKGAMMTSGYRRTYITNGESDPKGESEAFHFGTDMEPVEAKTMAFAKETAKRIPIKNIKLGKGSRTKVAGLKGWTFEGTANTRSGAEQWIKYTVLFDKDAYWFGLGMCPIAKKAKCKPMFKKIIKTVAFVEST